MRAFRVWRCILLLYVGLDLADPETCGIFSLLHDDLFLQGLTRPCGGAADAKPGRECRRTPAVFDGQGTTAPAAAIVARATMTEPRARHVCAPSVPRRALYAFAAGSLDSEDH